MKLAKDNEAAATTEQQQRMVYGNLSYFQVLASFNRVSSSENRPPEAARINTRYKGSLTVLCAPNCTLRRPAVFQPEHWNPHSLSLSPSIVECSPSLLCVCAAVRDSAQSSCAHSSLGFDVIIHIVIYIYIYI